MKNRAIIWVTIFNLVLTAYCGFLLFGNGCSSTPQTTAYRVEGVTIETVNTAVSIWKDYVNSGKATQAQMDAFKKAYLTYYDAQMVAKAALEKWVASNNPTDASASATADQAVTQAITALADVVRQYTGTTAL